MTSLAYVTSDPRNTSLTPGTLPSRAATSPAVSDSAMARVHPRWRRASTTTDSIDSPSLPNTTPPRRPRISDSHGRSLSWAAAGRLRRCGQADLQPVPTAGEERQRDVAVVVEAGDDVVEAGVEPALGLPPHLEDARGDHRRLAGTGEEVGEHGAFDHLLHLVGHPRDGVDHTWRCHRTAAGRSIPVPCPAAGGSPSPRRGPSPGAGCSRTSVGAAGRTVHGRHRPHRRRGPARHPSRRRWLPGSRRRGSARALRTR